MNKQQIEWAKQHDWYRSSQCLPDGTWLVGVRDDATSEPGNEQRIMFEDFRQLKAWAGY